MINSVLIYEYKQTEKIVSQKHYYRVIIWYNAKLSRWAERSVDQSA